MKKNNPHIKHIIGRLFVLSSALMLAIALIGSVYFNNSGLQILRKANLQREQELLSSFLVPVIKIADVTEAKRLLSLASDVNEKFVVIDGSSNILMPNYDDLSIVKASFINGNAVPDCGVVKAGYQIINGTKLLISCSALTANEYGKEHSFGILISFSPYPSIWFSSLVFYFFGIAVVSLLLNNIWFRRVLHKNLLNPLTTLGARIIEVARSPFNCGHILDGIENLPCEISEIRDAFQSVIRHLQAEYQQRTESEKKSALLDQAARVAHDIRSPIAAMEMSLHVFEQDIPKEKIVIMQMAVQSVRDIANNLLEKYRYNQYEERLLNNQSIILCDDVSLPRPILLYSMVEQIISQKRYEWLKNSCELTFDFIPEAKFIWINVVPGDVQRMISNLLNNAIEACEKHAKIHVQLNKVNNSLELLITDNGIGISLENMERFLSGESSKHIGRGMGLSGAKNYMESIEGQLLLCSKMKEGTTAQLAFPSNDKPSWFPDQINLSQNDIVVVLDDDVAMQALWFHRLQNYPIKIHLFSNYDEVVNWVRSHLHQLEKMIFLVDYELLEKAVNGLMLLRYFDVKDRGYLVTSHGEEVAIQHAVGQIGGYLIPKLLASEINIVLN